MPGLPPDRRIDFRIGIHLGDIVEESDGDLMGDGVNIAAQVTVSRMLQRIGRNDGEGQQTIRDSKITASLRVDACARVLAICDGLF